jgi:CHRD domain
MPARIAGGAGARCEGVNPRQRSHQRQNRALHPDRPARVRLRTPLPIILSPGNPPQNPITGMATLTDAQMQQFMSGQAYVNVHTQANPGGEVRGQVMMPR